MFKVLCHPKITLDNSQVCELYSPKRTFSEYENLNEDPSYESLFYLKQNLNISPFLPPRKMYYLQKSLDVPWQKRLAIITVCVKLPGLTGFRSDKTA